MVNLWLIYGASKKVAPRLAPFIACASPSSSSLMGTMASHLGAMFTKQTWLANHPDVRFPAHQLFVDAYCSLDQSTMLYHVTQSTNEPTNHPTHQSYQPHLVNFPAHYVGFS